MQNPNDELIFDGNVGLRERARAEIRDYFSEWRNELCARYRGTPKIRRFLQFLGKLGVAPRLEGISGFGGSGQGSGRGGGTWGRQTSQAKRGLTMYNDFTKKKGG